MTAEANKLVMHRFTEFINTASDQLAQELISPDAVFHVPGRSEPMRGPAGYLSIIGMMRAGFPGIQWTLEEMVAEGDKVAARFTMRGTHRGTFSGVPPTGKSIRVQAMNIYRLSDGQFVEERGQPDMLALPAADRCHPVSIMGWCPCCLTHAFSRQAPDPERPLGHWSPAAASGTRGCAGVKPEACT